LLPYQHDRLRPQPDPASTLSDIVPFVCKTDNAISNTKKTALPPDGNPGVQSKCVGNRHVAASSVQVFAEITLLRANENNARYSPQTPATIGIRFCETREIHCGIIG
jgi:hypothetical protein